MKIEYEIQELNRRIDETYDEYVKNLTELRNKKNASSEPTSPKVKSVSCYAPIGTAVRMPTMTPMPTTTTSR